MERVGDEMVTLEFRVEFWLWLVRGRSMAVGLCRCRRCHGARRSRWPLWFSFSAPHSPLIDTGAASSAPGHRGPSGRVPPLCSARFLPTNEIETRSAMAALLCHSRFNQFLHLLLYILRDRDTHALTKRAKLNLFQYFTT